MTAQKFLTIRAPGTAHSSAHEPDGVALVSDVVSTAAVASLRRNDHHDRRYQPTTGAASCLQAPNGFYVDTTKTTAATACGVGQVNAGLGSRSAAACVTPSLVFANTVFSAFAWGSITGSGLQPGAQVFFCADQVPSCFLTGFVPAANGTLVSGRLCRRSAGAGPRDQRTQVGSMSITSGG